MVFFFPLSADFLFIPKGTEATTRTTSQPSDSDAAVSLSSGSGAVLSPKKFLLIKTPNPPITEVGKTSF